MVYNTTKASVSNESFDTSLLEGLIYLSETEGKMFDSVINADFIQAVKEADLSEQEDDYETGSGATQPDNDTDEQVSKNIWQKIKDMLAKIKEAIVKAFDAIVEKIEKILNVDNKGIIDKYAQVLKNGQNIAGFEGLSNFTYVKDFEKAKAIVDIGKFKNVADHCTKILAGTGDADDINKECEAIISAANEAVKENVVSTENFKPDPQFMNVAIGALEASRSSVIKNLKETKKEVLDYIDTVAKTAVEQEKNATKDKNELAKKTNAYFNGIKSVSKAVLACTKISIDHAKLAFKAYRAAVMTVGAYAIKRSKGKAGEPEADENINDAVEFRYMLREMSDMYVDGILEL